MTTNIQPHQTTRPATFADALSAEPPAVKSGTTFKLALFGPDGVQLGWMGENGDGWAVLVSDQGKALTLESYPFNGVTYYRIVGGKYMSVSGQAYVGFYGWLGARGWTLENGHLVSQHNGQKLSLYSKDNGYLYAWDAYTVLTVRFVD